MYERKDVKEEMLNLVKEVLRRAPHDLISTDKAQKLAEEVQRQATTIERLRIERIELLAIPPAIPVLMMESDRLAAHVLELKKLICAHALGRHDESCDLVAGLDTEVEHLRAREAALVETARAFASAVCLPLEVVEWLDGWAVADEIGEILSCHDTRDGLDGIVAAANRAKEE